MKTQKIKISDYEWEKVLKDDIEIPIPTKPYFYREDNITVIGLFPQKITEDFASRKKGEVYQLSIVKVNLREIIRTNITVTANELSDIMQYGNQKRLCHLDYLRHDVVYYLRHHFGDGETTYDAFKNAVLGQINNISNDLKFEIK